MRILVSIPAQVLELRDDDGKLLRRYAVSTAKNGAGEQRGSYKTPRGKHIVRAKIGAGQPENTVFVRRRPTGEVWTPEFAAAHPGRDWILTRILWLSGKEPGFNRGGEADTMRRYVYLHGSPDSVPMGTPGSIGCVRMRNRDIVELFALVPAYTPVDIVEFQCETGSWDSLGEAAQSVRETVFVREQGVPVELELDDQDASSRHAIARDPAGKAVGTGRLTVDGHLGRMAVLPEWRGKGVGRALLEILVDAARQERLSQLALNAQTTATGFYARSGFAAEGEIFMDAGIAHIRMTRQLA